jgi:YD repeat-containing protein
MSDWAKRNVHGYVYALRTESAEWDLSLEQWRAVQHLSLVRFHPDGSINESESRNPDGSVSRSDYTYDPAGRLQEVRFEAIGGPTSKSIYFYDATGQLVRIVSVDADGSERETETRSYGQGGKRTKVYFVRKREPNVGLGFAINGAEQSYDADEVLFRDEDHRLLGRLVFTMDSTGRLIREEMRIGEETLFPDIGKALEKLPDATRAGTAAMIANLFGPEKVMSSTTYTYDARGRCLERRTRIGELGDHRTTFRYDEHDDPIEETTEDTSRDMRIDKTGKLSSTIENSHTQHLRFDYRYDAQRNWTERVVWRRLEPNPNFERSHIVRRKITYYAA